MHECPSCGFDCDCDGEDTWNEAPYRCRCECGHLDVSGGPSEPWGDEDEPPACGCKYCFCFNATIAGETCNDCLSRAARDVPDDDDFDAQDTNERDEEMAWVGHLETLLADTREDRHWEQSK